MIKVKRLTKTAVIPTRATEGSAGYDLYADIVEQIVVMPRQRVMINTGISIELETRQAAALIYARSGLAVKHGIVPSNCVGVIDSDYRGEIIVGLVNQSEQAYTIYPKDRIAQMVLTPILTPPLVEVTELEPTERGNGRFGSTLK